MCLWRRGLRLARQAPARKARPSRRHHRPREDPALVGTLAVAEEEEEEPKGKLTALLDFYFDFHPHPVAVHFPVALGVVSAVFLVLYLLTGSEGFEISGYYVLWASLIMSPFAMLTGAVSWLFNYGRVLDVRFSAKISMSIILLIVEAAGVALRTMNPTSLVDREPLGWVYFLAVVIVVPLVALLGRIGADITFPKHKA